MLNNGQAKFSTPTKKQKTLSSLTVLQVHQSGNIRDIIHKFHKNKGRSNYIRNITLEILNKEFSKPESIVYLKRRISTVRYIFFKS